jgi:DNA/RNA endonuclease YhcR with UshA esterase domain
MRLEKRMSIRVLRLSAMVVAVGGLLLLHLYTLHRELPIVRIGDISPVMNFATVRVEGVLESDARPVRGGSILYVVDDGTGLLPVFSNQTPDGKLPKAGSRVSIAGSLSVGAGEQVRMSARSEIEILDEARSDNFVSELKLADITAEQDGARMTVYGRVSKVWKTRAGSKAPNKIVLEDDSGTLDVVHWLKDVSDIQPGDELEISGILNVYEGRLQLKLRDAADVQPYLKNCD